MQVVTTIGLDIAKSVFEVHGVDAHGRVVVRRQLKRRYVLPFFKKVSPCLVGIEACAAYLQQALAVIRYAKLHGTKHRPWLTAPLARRPTKVAAIALANKIARMAWAMMAKGERQKEPAALAA